MPAISSRISVTSLTTSRRCSGVRLFFLFAIVVLLEELDQPIELSVDPHQRALISPTTRSGSSGGSPDSTHGILASRRPPHKMSCSDD
jgi:hypothetical protein